MSNVIPFPTARAAQTVSDEDVISDIRRRFLARKEAILLDFPKSCGDPERWNGHHEYVFDYLIETERKCRDATIATVEAMIYRDRSVPGEKSGRQDTPYRAGVFRELEA